MEKAYAIQALSMPPFILEEDWRQALAVLRDSVAGETDDELRGALVRTLLSWTESIPADLTKDLEALISQASVPTSPKVAHHLAYALALALTDVPITADGAAATRMLTAEVDRDEHLMMLSAVALGHWPILVMACQHFIDCPFLLICGCHSYRILKRQARPSWRPVQRWEITDMARSTRNVWRCSLGGYRSQEG